MRHLKTVGARRYHIACSISRTQTLGGTKSSRHGDVAPWICASLGQPDIFVLDHHTRRERTLKQLAVFLFFFFKNSEWNAALALKCIKGLS